MNPQVTTSTSYFDNFSSNLNLFFLISPQGGQQIDHLINKYCIIISSLLFELLSIIIILQAYFIIIIIIYYIKYYRDGYGRG